ncbi:MAG: RdgB/HAM1 family non-canonical purine NTP pyrophosphatase [Microthrixaceae bacterium]
MDVSHGIPSRLVLASANPKKVAELSATFRSLGVTATSGLPVELLPRPDSVAEVIEDADSFIGNARLKAVALALATNEVALADDSGLVVDSLGGAPGVYSARYAGPQASDQANLQKLLSELGLLAQSASPVSRAAQFCCVIVLRWPDGFELSATGFVSGHICEQPQGSAGFGYDPVFVPDLGDGRTFAQMSPEEKQKISHRGQALRGLAAQLADLS